MALAWMPKATVQAAFGSVASGYVRELLAKETDETARQRLLQEQVCDLFFQYTGLSRKKVFFGYFDACFMHNIRGVSHRR